MVSDTLHVDVLSDVVCPWCLIACRRLELAAERLGSEASVDFELHPFLLDPSVPPEGSDLRDHLRRKFGDPEPMFRRIEKLAREDGIDLDFERIRRFSSTVRAHTLIRAAREKGTQWQLGRAIFAAYFVEGRDIADLGVLCGLASSHGFSADEARTLLSDRDALATTLLAARAASERGIRGVPFIMFMDGRAISGAQSVEVFEKALRDARPPEAS